MIHILTVHWQSPMWIDIQLQYINHYLQEPYKVYAYLNEISDFERFAKKFYYASNEEITSHAIKLNTLADMACFNSNSENDILLFIDGDAFPINPLDNFIADKLKEYSMAAIQRLENDGDIQPHPSFCITTVKFWKEIKGDWKAGTKPCFNMNGNGIRDVGCILHHKITENNTSWYKMLRSNSKRFINQVDFGVYDNLIYHHGAGFRPPVTRNDKKQVKNFRKKKLRFRKMKKILPEGIAEKYFNPFNSILPDKEKAHKDMYQFIKSDFNFHKKL